MKLNWDEKRTTAENMHSMGLVSDVNAILPIPKSSTKMGLPDADQLMEEAEPELVQQLLELGKKKKTDSRADKGHVAVCLQEEAQRPQDKNFKFGPELCKFIVQMIEKHGNDFKKMAMDRTNRYQYSAGEIKRMIKKFMSIDSHRRAFELAVDQCSH